MFPAVPEPLLAVSTGNLIVAIVIIVIGGILALKVVGWIFKALAILLLGAGIYIIVA